VILQFLSESGWDRPFFKQLAHNDTGAAAGHQGGVVIPKELRQYFPALEEEKTSHIQPSTDRRFRAELYDGLVLVADVITRYQLQTWGGTRSAESRLTDELGPIRNRARAGDIMIFQRRQDSLDQFRIVLVPARSNEFSSVEKLIQSRRWGALLDKELPLTQKEFIELRGFLENQVKSPFHLLSDDVARIETRQKRILRNTVFPSLVKNQYGNRCCISGVIVSTPAMMFEAEACHVVPVSAGGIDDVRNGLALCRTLHWAFDYGLFGINAERCVVLPSQVAMVKENAYLRQLEGTPMREAKHDAMRVHPDALKWHIENKVSRWT
jgi:putative restriction endonuclease